MVMVYTSARPQNAAPMVDKLLDSSKREKLVAVWARDKLDLTRKQYHQKVQVYKKLDRIWSDPIIQSKCPDGQGRWSQTNTILIDDSHLKALAQPHNLIQVPEFTGNKGTGLDKIVAAERERQILKALQMKLEVLKFQSDISRQIFLWQTGSAELPRLPPTSELASDESLNKRDQSQLLVPKNPDEDGQAEEKDIVEISSGKSEDSDIQRDLARQMAKLSAGSFQREKSVSPIPEGIWKEILEPEGTQTRFVVTRKHVRQRSLLTCQVMVER